MNASVPIAGVRLRASPNFSLNFTQDGRAFVARDVEPYTQFWLSEPERVLLSLFSSPKGARTSDVLSAYGRLTGADGGINAERRLHRTIRDMREAGVLVADGDDVSRYDATMAQDYLTHRAFPALVADAIVRDAGIHSDSRILDLAAGPGSLALELARTADHVAMMELSRGFVAAARREARRLNRPLEALNESCNRLISHDQTYDLITVSQALHWLDDVAVCRGVCRTLREGGSFVVVHGGLDLRDDHPLSYILGDRTPLGDKQAGSFRDQATALARRVALLFEALDTPDVHRIDPSRGWAGDGAAPTSPIRPLGGALFRQTRVIDEGFARAFLSPAHIAGLGQTPEAFWSDLTARCTAAEPKQKTGVQNWAVLRFGRGVRAWTPGRFGRPTTFAT